MLISEFSKSAESAETILEKNGFAEKGGLPLADEELNVVAGGNELSHNKLVF